MTWSTTRAVRVGTVEVGIEVEIVSECNVPASEHVVTVARAVEVQTFPAVMRTPPMEGMPEDGLAHSKNPGCLLRVGAGDKPYRRLAPR